MTWSRGTSGHRAAREAEQQKADPALRKALSDKRRVGRSRLPDHLPRVEIVIAPEDTACPCCGGAMHVIGEDRSQRLACSGDCDRPFRPKVITDSGDRDHA